MQKGECNFNKPYHSVLNTSSLSVLMLPYHINLLYLTTKGPLLTSALLPFTLIKHVVNVVTLSCDVEDQLKSFLRQCLFPQEAGDHVDVAESHCEILKEHISHIKHPIPNRLLSV